MSKLEDKVLKSIDEQMVFLFKCFEAAMPHVERLAAIIQKLIDTSNSLKELDDKHKNKAVKDTLTAIAEGLNVRPLAPTAKDVVDVYNLMIQVACSKGEQRVDLIAKLAATAVNSVDDFGEKLASMSSDLLSEEEE